MSAPASALCSVVETIGSHAALQPEYVALHSASGAITYSALWEYSARIAARLNSKRSATVAGSTPIALLMRHDTLLPVAILGVLRSRHSYAALDPRFPIARLRDILHDTGAEFLLIDNTHQSLAEALRRVGSTPNLINVEEIVSSTCDAAPIFAANHLYDAAAIFYTSGSTGQPKGVLQNHRCVAHTARNYAAAMQLTSADTVLYAVNAAVGASSSLIFGTLCSGAALHVFDFQENNLATLARQIQDERTTVLHCVPSLFRALFENLNEIDLPFLHAIKLGGEAVTGRDLQVFQRARKQKKIHADCRFINGLGITEASGNVCFFDATRLDSETISNIPVGFAAPGYELELQPGAAGDELIIVSDYLADGYWNKPQETTIAFQTRPDGKRFYRSGDAARFNADGALEYSGRLNHRVKIRGRQVDLLEVESALQSVEYIARVVVIFHEEHQESDELDDAGFLVACYQSQKNQEIRSEVLRVALAQTLPDFMVPARFVFIENWPLLPSGKTDLRALQSGVAADVKRERSGNEKEFERSDAYDPLEAQLQRIWQKALRLKHIKTTDDFFALGGHSLAAAEITVELHRHFNVEIPLTAMTLHPTIKQLALAMRRQKIDNHSRFLGFNLSGTRAPLFFAPGAGNDAFSLVELAQNLKAEQPFIALHPPGLDGISPFPKTIKAFAQYYLQTIREIAPHGPYFLGGSSFGGVVMFEVARQLQAQNETVALLALIDAKAVGYPKPRRMLGCVTPLYLLWKTLPLHNKFSFTPRNIARGVREQSALRQARCELQSSNARPFARRFLHLRHASFDAKKNYRPAPYDGDVHLFPSEIQPLSSVFETDENLGWTPYVSGQLVRRVLPGAHGAYLRVPDVAILTQFLCEALESNFSASEIKA